ncbi:MAG: hypothetical protein SH856_15295 [Flavobacteriales bacterium]|nr:hypothetical protein [Flavobacteriales bacterium]
MSQEKDNPQFMLIYHCSTCEQDSGFSELEDALCRFCNKNNAMTLVSKQELTPEVMAARLKEVTNNMMKNLEVAFNSMTDEDKVMLSGEGNDAEQQMLELLAKVQKFRDDVQGMELKDPEKKDKEIHPPVCNHLINRSMN